MLAVYISNAAFFEYLLFRMNSNSPSPLLKFRAKPCQSFIFYVSVYWPSNSLSPDYQKLWSYILLWWISLEHHLLLFYPNFCQFAENPFLEKFGSKNPPIYLYPRYVMYPLRSGITAIRWARFSTTSSTWKDVTPLNRYVVQWDEFAFSQRDHTCYKVLKSSL